MAEEEKLRRLEEQKTVLMNYDEHRARGSSLWPSLDSGLSNEQDGNAALNVKTKVDDIEEENHSAQAASDKTIETPNINALGNINEEKSIDGMA